MWKPIFICVCNRSLDVQLTKMNHKNTNKDVLRMDNQITGYKS